MKTAITTLFLITLILPAKPVFTNGVHIDNRDDKPVQMKLVVPLTTRICRVKKGTKTIKNGIASVTVRKPKNIKVTHSGNGTMDQATITIPPKTAVPCICTTGCTLDITGFKKISVKNKHTIVIEQGKLKLRK